MEWLGAFRPKRSIWLNGYSRMQRTIPRVQSQPMSSPIVANNPLPHRGRAQHLVNSTASASRSWQPRVKRLTSKGCAACLMRRDDGFTLVEALAAVAITALLVSLMFPVVAQWLGTLTRTQRALDGEDQLLRSTVALQADLEDAIILPLTDEVKTTGSPPIVFRGDARGLIFPHMRIAGDTAWRPMLVGWTIDRLPDGQEALVRRSSPYDPSLRDADPHDFANQIPLIASKDGLRLAYVGRDGGHTDQWLGQSEPPALVLVEFGRSGTSAASAYSLSLTVPVRGAQFTARAKAPSSGD